MITEMINDEWLLINGIEIASLRSQCPGFALATPWRAGNSFDGEWGF